MINKILLFLSIVFSSNLFSQSDKNGLLNDILLHPNDAFTGYTLKKGEWIYNQALTPYPSWAWWGITDRITTEIDFEAWLGGVPSVNFRLLILKQNKFCPNLAYESMFQYINNEFDQMENLDYLNIIRKGSSWYNHLNASWKISDKIFFHLSGGLSYSENLTIENGDSLNGIGNSYSNLLSPDLSLSVDYRIKPWITAHTTISYGTTFLYIDNVPRKKQFGIGTRVAPFVNNKNGFLNCFRFELSFISVRFDDADTNFNGPIGFFYWQWMWNKRE